jgi:phytoene synthase
LGIALQLTNILRDVKQDAQNGRIYIPKEDLERFGYSEEDIRNSVYDERFRALMRFECDRARDYYRKAARHLFEEDKTLFAAARAMGNIYYQLLQNIERANYNVFTNRICLSLPRKMFIIIILHLRNMFPVFMRRRFPVILPV